MPAESRTPSDPPEKPPASPRPHDPARMEGQVDRARRGARSLRKAARPWLAALLVITAPGCWDGKDTGRTAGAESQKQPAPDQERLARQMRQAQEAAALVDKAADPVAWALAQGEVAFILHSMARHREAEPLMREVLRLREQHLGPDDPATATALHNLALLLQATNRLAEAETLLRRVVRIILLFQARTGHPHHGREKFLGNYTRLLQAMNVPEADIAARLRELEAEANAAAAGGQ